MGTTNFKNDNKELYNSFVRSKIPVKSVNEIYSVFSDYYDLSMNHIDYDGWASYLAIISDMHDFTPNSILDLACGTGSMIIALDKQGHKQIDGCDLSHFMLKKARQKINISVNNPHDINLFSCDMRKLNCVDKYDLIISLNDSFNYMNSLNDLKLALESCYKQLNDGGTLFFDLSSESNIFKNFNETICEKFLRGAYTWANCYDPTTRILYSNLDFLDYASGNVYRESHKQRIHTLDEVEKILFEIGFKETDMYGGFSLAEPIYSNEVFHIWTRKIM